METELESQETQLKPVDAEVDNKPKADNKPKDDINPVDTTPEIVKKK